MLSQIQFQMLHCDVFQQHPLVGIEQIETGNRFQVVEPVTVDDLRSIAGVEHAGRISRRTPLLHVLIGIDGNLCAEKYLLPLQSGRLSLPVRLTPNDLCYLQAALSSVLI